MSNYTALHLHSHGSFDSVSRPRDIIKKATNFGMGAIALTDHGTLGAIPEFYTEAKKAGIKPILGIEMYVCAEHSTIKTPENRSCRHLVILAKNLRGWKMLLKMVKQSNSEESYYYKPRLSLEEIAQINSTRDLICIDGHPGSKTGGVIFADENAAFNAKSYEEAKSCVDMQNWRMKLDQSIWQGVDVFGKDNYIIEIQRMDEDRLFMAQILNKALRHAAERLHLNSTATHDAHYVNQEDAILQRILLAGRMKTTLVNVKNRLDNSEDVGMGGFFRSSNYYILSPQEMKKWHTEKELKTSLEIADMCENYEINAPSECPKYPFIPEGSNSTDYLHKLCMEGYDKIYRGRVDDSIYLPRLQRELDLYRETKLEDYFLVTKNILDYLRSQNRLYGVGRGSVGGALSASCLGITLKIDPIKFGLLFERFLNPDRAKKGEKPDIDLDVPRTARDLVLKYIVDTYGEDYVAQVAAFGNYKGKSALKLVLKAMDVPFALQNEITQWIPDEQKITDDLAEYAEEHEGSKSILKIALEDNKDKLSRYARIQGEDIVGEFAEHFSLAIRMEYIRSHMSKHAAAVLIGHEPLVNKVPLVKESNSNSLIAGWSYPESEWAGFLKWDILGLAALDGLEKIAERLHNRGIL